MATTSNDGNSIRVAIRCRPFNSRETLEGAADEAVLSCSDTTVALCDEQRQSKTFHFDCVFDWRATQECIFQGVGTRLLENALDAYNGCIFAYGQTGSGKSHSMVGNLGREEEKGILPRACVRLFEMLAAKQKSADSRFQATVLASYLEIYNEKIFDLLSSGGREGGELQVRLHPNLGAIVVNLTECPMECFEEALELFDFGAKQRAVGATQMNATSSRSHAVFTIQIRMLVAGAGGPVESQAKIHFVDLAGSEKQKKSGATGARLKEGIGINQSLTTLGRVISDLTKVGNKNLPPFRDSKLTLLLKDALMGNSRTDLLACISPSKFNAEETIGTLEFAARCKLVKTRAKKNEQSREDLIAKLTAEKERIEMQLRQEKQQGEEFCRQLQLELATSMERQKAAELALNEKLDIEERLRQVEGQRSYIEKEREVQLLKNQERERLLQEKEDKLREAEQETVLHKQNNAQLEALLREREEQLLQSSSDGEEADELVHVRMIEEKEQEAFKEQELLYRLEEERKAQQAREQELVSHLEALKGVQESWALDQKQINVKRETQHEHREAELSKLGMHFSGIDGEDMPSAPRLVNMHPDPALKGCLVYYLPVGETVIGSSAELCHVKLSGLNIGKEVCAVSNCDNEMLEVRPRSEGLVRVNGRMVGASGQQLSDGDRLAIGRAYIFQVHIPRATKFGEDVSHAEDEFECAMDEIAACAEVDPQWENGVQKAMLLVKSDFGTDAANELLVQARRASEAIAMANVVLHEMPEGWTDGVTKYELSVMFDAHGLPSVCIVARRDQSAGSSSSGLRSGALSGGIWEVDQFTNERLPLMHEALLLAKMEGEPSIKHWESRVWSDISVHDYKTLTAELTLSEARLEGTEAQAHPTDSPREHGWGWFSSAAAQFKQNVKAVQDAVKETTTVAASLKSNRPPLQDVGSREGDLVRAQRLRGGVHGKPPTTARALARAVSPAGLFRSMSSGRLDRSKAGGAEFEPMPRGGRFARESWQVSALLNTPLEGRFGSITSSPGQCSTRSAMEASPETPNNSS